MIKTTFDYNERLFGTDGIRGKVNAGKVTALMAVNLAMAAGEYFYGKAGTKKPRVLIGKDTRLSGYMLEPALVAGFTSLGLDAITTGPLPTPAIAHLTRVLRCDLGVMISASHNPFEDNGLKLFGADGYKLSDDVENEIQSRMVSGPILAKSSDLGRPVVFFELGAETISLGIEPNGKNINNDCGAMFPNRMAQYTKSQGADLGIALDGDADRVIFSDENGKIIHGDHIIAVLADEMKRSNQLKENKVIGTLMSNLGLETFLQSINIELHRTKVGDRYILDEMIQSKSNLGGEPSGHILLTDYAKTGDGLLTAIKIVSLLKKSGLKASEYFRPFKLIPQSLKSLKNINKNILDNKIVKQKLLIVKQSLSKNERFLVRASGTEDLLRIMVESKDENRVNEITEQIVFIIVEQNKSEKNK